MSQVNVFSANDGKVVVEGLRRGDLLSLAELRNKLPQDGSIAAANLTTDDEIISSTNPDRLTHMFLGSRNETVSVFEVDH